ncbi:MAG: hypothetical protein PHS56_00450 [Eubacteriales bacterium]|nr:hypothetical protein [Eubacteriales bacterium]
MNILPPPLTQAPPARSFWQDFRLLAATQLRLTRNKLRQWRLRTWLFLALPTLSLLALLIFLGEMAYGAMETMTPEIGQGFLSLLFMAGEISSIFFGVTAAFASLYMSEDLELLFVAPVSTRAIFAVKTLSVAFSNLLGAGLFIFLPGLFFGLLLKASFLYYLWLILITLGLLALGTALAELLNLIVMRIVPPHRSKEAVGFIGAISGIVIALLFQIPNLIISSGASLDLAGWLGSQQQLLQVMNWFPWGWGALALVSGSQGSHLVALSWSLLTLALATAVFVPAFLLVERGFRRGWISLSQGGGSRKKAKARKIKPAANGIAPVRAWDESLALASPIHGMWAVAKKDLLSIKRDTREWFGYLTPLLLMMFFVGRALFLPGGGAEESLVGILIMYTVMFSGNMALQSFGREGESSWLLNSVPLAGWPVVWGKLLAAVLPTLILMELLLTGTAIAIGLPPNIIIAMALGAILISLGASAIGLFYSINNCRYNPDVPQQRISFGATIMMFLINLLFTGLLALCLVYTFPPATLMDIIQQLPPMDFVWGFPETLLYLVYLLTRPLTWAPALRVIFGLAVTMLVWAAVFFGFMQATVRQSRKGFRVQLVTSFKKR